MASVSYTDFFNRVTEKQPVFDFLIKNNDFYINTHGVSVTEFDKSYTTLSDGKFYVLNKNNKTFYFNGLYLSSVRMRRENGYPTIALRAKLIDTRVIGNFVYEDYYLNFRGKDIGKLTISRLTRFANNNNIMVSPFQSIEMYATYSVLNVNNLSLQYYGKSNIAENKNKGTIDVNFNIRCFTDKEYTNQISENLTITINTINSGFVPTAPPSIIGTTGTSGTSGTSGTGGGGGGGGYGY
jgi:hypothetical protein